MKHERPELSTEERASWKARYEETNYRDLPWFSSTPYPWVREAVKERVWQRGARILDIGCGAGTNALFLARSGYRAYGVDVAPGAVAAARRRARTARLEADFRESDALRLPFPKGMFAGAIDVGCFHTLPPKFREAYARGIARVLRRDGVLALAVVAREFTQEFGPPHRLALAEVAGVFEPYFLVQRTRFTGGWGVRKMGKGGLPAYELLLQRRSSPQPPPH